MMASSYSLSKYIESLIWEGANISIDSRTVKRGDVFFAISGGRKFVEDAISKGASVVVVEDSLNILLEIGRNIKEQSKAKIIGITGSLGKTTTKFWLSEVLGSKHKVLCGMKNYNTIIGIPICLSQLNSSHEYGIFEMGSNNPGEIAELSMYLQPDVAVITNITEAHIGKFGNKEAIAFEKVSVIEGIKEGGTLIYNGDSEFKDLITEKAKKKNLKTISYGFCENNNFVARGNHYDFIKACIKATIFALDLNINEFIGRFQELKPPNGRGNIEKYSYQGKIFTVIDSSYNASPSSVIASIEELSKMNGYRRKVAVLGEMRELGEYSAQYHRSVEKKAREANIDVVISVTSNDIEKIPALLENDDIVLLKGSRSVSLERMLDVFQRIV